MAEVTVAEMARRLGVSPRRVRQLIASGALRARHVTPRLLLVQVPAEDPRQPHGRPPKTAS